MPSRSVAPYRPRAAEHTVLHALVRDHLATFLRAADADGRGLPAFVEQEFRDFLTCGVWARGFARFQCAECHAERRSGESADCAVLCPCLGTVRTAARAANRVAEASSVLRSPVRESAHLLPFLVCGCDDHAQRSPRTLCHKELVSTEPGMYVVSVQALQGHIGGVDGHRGRAHHRRIPRLQLTSPGALTAGVGAVMLFIRGAKESRERILAPEIAFDRHGLTVTKHIVW